ncbi:unknown protein [Cronobacter turicensis z3032]|uniref:Uncharacterized protein n=1 Tax=Cronobacter turicensis (strain DSM 18703 / CCUG 55852 / LMG 23827 / z3032) TaxID=693216 RepID=C9Y0Q4_CROTZ|nr:unknown protein [Cronobacter turicensis z3032]
MALSLPACDITLQTQNALQLLWLSFRRFADAFEVLCVLF